MTQSRSPGFWDALRELYLEEHGNTQEFEVEKEQLTAALEALSRADEFAAVYEIGRPLGVGGAGIVIQVEDKRLGLHRALKLPRPSADRLIESVLNEIQYLREIRHNNIVRLYSLGHLDFPGSQRPYPYFVMEYIENAQDLRKRVLSLLDEAQESNDVKHITWWLAEEFYKLVEAGEFLHQRQVIHFDFKPGNILIGPDDNLILTDLGFAKKKSDQEDPVVVGFTHFYAHPDLRREYTSMSDKNRVRKEICPRDFRYAWDIYACGRSLLEMLALIDSRFGEAVQYDYPFLYLHLAACRMLDGKNLSKGGSDNIRERQKQQNNSVSVYNETWLDLDGADLSQLRYRTFAEVRLDLLKLVGGDSFLQEIPEISQSYPKRTQSSGGVPASFSKRVKRIVEHPVFTRLMYIHQLGLLISVYPTATHNRFEHSLGTFRNACLYVEALFRDPYNPLFRQLVTIKDIKLVILASLLHDLGQYPLAHELEEASDALRHEEFTLKFLDNRSTDRLGFTLQDIVENDEWGWGLKIGELTRLVEVHPPKMQQRPLFERETPDLKTRMLRSIIDGPLDVDKLDYLLRDSQNCYVPYGAAIDTDRLIRNLTVIIVKEEGRPKDLVLGTYEKGQSAAEALIFARYLMYLSLYWHHTDRAARAMLMQATRSAMNKQRTKSTPKKPKGDIRDFFQAFDDLLGTNTDPNNVTSDEILELIGKWTDQNGKRLISMIRERNYFKRILTLHYYPDPNAEKGKPSLLASFRNACRTTQLQEALQSTIAQEFDNFVKSTEYPKTSVLAPERANNTLSLLNTPNMILCDCPDPNYGTKGKLRFIPEPARLQRNYLARSTAGMRISEAWHHVHYELMEIAAKGRVLCHPDIRDPIMAALGPQRLEAMVRQQLSFM